jgi:hypothetical protein
MNFGELKTELRDLMARTDYTNTKAGQHINRAINRLSRVQGLPNMEKAVEVVLETSPSIPIPTDFITIKHLIFGDVDLRKLPYSVFLTMPEQGTQPRWYSRIRAQWDVRPAAPGLEGVLIYVAEWPSLVADTDSNELLVSAPEAVLYGAASYACTYFKDTRLEEFEARYKGLAEETAEQNRRAELSSPTGMILQTPYDGLDY